MLATAGGGGGGGCRITHHLRECNFHQIRYNNNGINTLGLYYAKTLQLSSYFFVGLPPFSPIRFKLFDNSFHSTCFRRIKNSNDTKNNNNAISECSISCVQPNSSNTQSPALSDSLSQREDGQEPPSELMSPIAGGVVALGKFDALHIGHRELAIQAAKMGVPYLLSFVGMAEVFGWEPRAPIVAKCDRKRVLSMWSPVCGSMTPKEFEIEFSKVRSLTPRQFVEKLSKELGVRGVVAGENYRFGYRAAGNSSDLVRLCGEYGMDAHIINSVMDKNHESRNINSSDSKDQGQVSSTRVRHALSKGDMKYVSELLGRHHRLVLPANDPTRFVISQNRLSAPTSCLLNLPPREGLYGNCLLFMEEKNAIPCRVIVENEYIHLELDEVVDICTRITSQGVQLLGIEFGELEFGGE